MFAQRIVIEDPTFDLKTTVESHGWHQLPPFTYADGKLSRVQRLADGRVVHIHIQQTGNTSRESFLLVETEGPAFQTDHAEIDSVVRRVLCMDWRMDQFYALTRSLPAYHWVEDEKQGRLLRSASVWEDLAKTLLTTNTTWKQTIGMCQRLVTLGTESAWGHAFPTPEQVAALDVAALTAHVKAGYRGAYLHKLADGIASGELKVEAWRDETDSIALFKQIRALKGYGDYATGSVLRLLGHHDALTIDSVAREVFMHQHNHGEKPSDKAIREHYAQYGNWQGMILWMDVIQHYR